MTLKLKNLTGSPLSFNFLSQDVPASGELDISGEVVYLSEVINSYDDIKAQMNSDNLIFSGPSGDMTKANSISLLDSIHNDNYNYPKSGTTDNRPSTPKKGEHYFDETLGKPIWHDGTNWIDATGTTV
jgi:hypothetical protein